MRGGRRSGVSPLMTAPRWLQIGMSVYMYLCMCICIWCEGGAYLAWAPWLTAPRWLQIGVFACIYVRMCVWCEEKVYLVRAPWWLLRRAFKLLCICEYFLCMHVYVSFTWLDSMLRPRTVYVSCSWLDPMLRPRTVYVSCSWLDPMFRTSKSSVMAVLGCNGLRCVIKIIVSLPRASYPVWRAHVNACW
jgi:hypothetical protein